MSGYWLDQIGQRLGDLGGADDDDVDSLLGEVADDGGRVGRLDVVDDDRLFEAVLGRQRLGRVDDRLIVGAVVGWARGGDAEDDLTVAVGVEGVGFCRGGVWCVGGHWLGC